MTASNTLNTATIVFISAAAVTLGGLIGMAIIGERQPRDAAAQNHTDSAPTGAAPLPAQRRLPFRVYDGQAALATLDDKGNIVPAAVGENVVRAGQAFGSETIEFTLAGNGAVEYKAIMRSGAPLVYSWRANGPVYFDFHAHDERNPSGYFSRYGEGESIADAGGIVAAYDGQHGWYWQNTGPETIKITLTVAGFYDDLVELAL